VYSEDELLPLSGLQHMAFCERRWALVQIEDVWADNRFTAEGKALHETAHSGDIESRPGALIRRTVPIHSFRLGISGQADVVEFLPVHEGAGGIELAGRRGRWRPYTIEYKRRRDKAGSMAYRVQLCAQALCLEEMLGIAVAEGAVYDASTRRRQTVIFDDELRRLVESLAERMHELFRQKLTPPPVLKKACRSCSLFDQCLPEKINPQRSVSRYLERWLATEIQ
jgi:CRISPR-associated exonuclease Cas4